MAVVARLSPTAAAALAGVAAGLHDPELGYHNFSHAQRAAAAGARLVARCQAEGVDVDGEVVHWALLFHDAGYRDDPADSGAATREEHAADLAGRHLAGAGAGDELITGVRSAIEATHAQAIPHSVEDKIVRAADLAELAGDYRRFSLNSACLKAEAELLSGRSIGDAEWRTLSIRVISAYLAEDICLTSGHDDPAGLSAFHARALASLDRYVAELEHRPGRSG